MALHARPFLPLGFAVQVGIDFGTTNTVIALPDGAGGTRSAMFGSESIFRSVLCFWMEEARAGQRLRHAAGAAAIEAYLDDPLDSRLIMSMKTYLAQRSFVETRIFGRRFTLPELVAHFLREAVGAAGLDPAALRVVAGRPVRFAGGSADDAFGEERLREAFAAAGFPEVTIALEPEAAGWRFARGLTRPATVLVGDFGGGTSDFSVLRFVPGQPVVQLGHAGVGVAGDMFDYRIIDHAISPLLGKHDSYRVFGKDMPIPIAYFRSFANWHSLSLMRGPKTLREIADVAKTARYPERLRALLALIQDEQGFPLYRAVTATKAALSQAETAVLRFSHGAFEVDETLSRADFESWIAPDLAAMGGAIDRALAAAGEPVVDHVFLTGGTSFVPAVRRLFDVRFDPAIVTAGGEFVSVAEGLALMG